MPAAHFGFPARGPPGRAHATIGPFDGVHGGHQALLKPLIAGARREGATSVLVTFEPHPRCVLDPDHCPPSLTTLEEKTWLLDQFGVEQLIVIPFTAQVAALTPAAFMQRLTRGIQLRHLITGANFRFGQGRRGDPAFLRRLGERQGFTVEVTSTLTRSRAPVSSTRIRRVLLLGQMRAPAPMLGDDYLFRSSVERSAKRGRELGFPTANLRLAPGKLGPATGGYAARGQMDGQAHQGALSVGFRPTFGGHTLTVEVFIIDFEGDLYDRLLTVWFVQRLRVEKRFASIPGLQQQMGRDVE